MTHVTEKMDIMDTITSFRKQKNISISRPLAGVLLVLFILGVIATGLLTYHFAPKTRVIEDCNLTFDHIPSLHSTSESPKTEIDIDYETIEITTTEVAVPEVPPKLSLRLPRSIEPTSYELYLLPFIFEGNFTFHGNVSILVNVAEPTRNITLHADELQIDENSVEVLKIGGSRIQIREITNETERQLFVIHFSDELEQDTLYEVRMRFVGILNDVLQGFYRSSYLANSTKKWIAATQFQPTDARKAFPCFDEPALKATFQIHLGRHKNMSSISNMPKINSTEIENVEDYVWDHFEKSVPMSTYLVAFLVSDFDHVTNGTVSVWFRKSAANQSAFSLKIGPALLKYYEDFFQIKFPLPKIDMVALPDFSTGAMENWGLITYRETALLYEPSVSSGSNLQSVAIVVAHELAHQWFGNLVTPTWWTDLWLNEGFASYMEYLGADAVCPELKIMDQFVVSEVQSVFTLDALKSSHPISIEVNNPEEINNIFDKISYGKGSTIIRMMDNILTSSVFRKGLTNYLNERKYSNAEQDDLWSALSDQAHKDNVLEENVTVKEIMDTWTLQTGFPVITVVRDYKNSATLKQERFLISGKSNESQSLWWVPITYITRNDQTLRKTWMKVEKEIKLYIQSKADDWLLLNVNQTGYYRVNYDVRNWELLIAELNSKNGHLKFDVKNRAQLLDDSFHLASAGYLPYDVALNVTKYLIYEREHVPWRSAFQSIEHLLEIFLRSANFDKFKKYMLYLLRGLYEDLGFHEKPSDSTLTIHTRTELLRKICKLGYRDCIINSIQEFQKWRTSVNPDSSNPILPNLRSIVYCNAIMAGGQEEWDFAWKRYLKADVGSEREIIMTALGCSRDSWILRRYLEWSVTDNSGIRKQDSTRVFGFVSRSSIIGQHISYTFLKSNWHQIKAYLGSSVSLLTLIVRETVSIYPTPQELDDIKQFFSNNKSDFNFATRPFQQIIEQGEAHLKWTNTNFGQIVNWLLSQEVS